MAYPTTARTERTNDETERLGELGGIGLAPELNEIQDDLTALTEKVGTDASVDAGSLDKLVTDLGILVATLQDDLYARHNADGTHKLFTESSVIPTVSLADNAVTAAKMGAIVTKTITARPLNHLGAGAAISATVTLQQGAANNGVYSFVATVDLTSLSIPADFYLLSIDGWMSLTGNLSPHGIVPVAITAVSNTSLSFQCQGAGNSVGFPNQNNCGFYMRMRYIV